MMIDLRPFALFSRTVTASFLIGSVVMASEAMQHWDAFSRSAEGITGDINLSPSRIVFQNGTALELSYIGRARGIFYNSPEDVAQIYRIAKPENPILLNGNPLCNETPSSLASPEPPSKPSMGQWSACGRII